MSAVTKAALIGAAAGALIGGVYAWNPRNIPSSIAVARTIRTWWIWMLVAAYFVIGWAILFAFFRPKTTEGIIAVLGGGVLWNIF